MQISDANGIRDTWRAYFYSFNEDGCEADFIRINRHNGETKTEVGKGRFLDCAIPDYFLMSHQYASGANAAAPAVTLAHLPNIYMNWGVHGAERCGEKVQRSSDMSWLTELATGAFFEVTSN